MSQGQARGSGEGPMSADESGAPTVPPEVREWMERYGLVPLDRSAPELTRGAVRALREALRRPGRVREGAYALLAADGLLTYTIEACLNEEDPEAGLRDVLAILGDEA